MNIAIFASAFYPHVGGVEELVRQLAHAYRAAGHTAIVVTNQWPPTLSAHEEYEGIPIYRLPMRLPEGNWKQRIKYSLTQSGTVRQMLTILRHHAIDLLHVQCVSVNGYYALLAKQALSLPLVVTAQGERTIDAGKIYERSWYINQVLRHLLTQAGAITACSRDTLADIETFYRQPFGSRGSVVYNGIRLEDFAAGVPYAHKRPYVLGIGRLVPQKGFDILIDAFAQSPPETHDLLLAGEGRERDALQAQIEKYNLQSRIFLMGRADRPKAVAFFKGCDFFVLPSRQEPFGIVNLEAMAAGKAIIASRIGGVPEIVQDEENGLLVPAEDAAALAQALNRLASDPQMRQRLAQNGQSRIAKFTWAAIANHYLAIYQAIR